MLGSVCKSSPDESGSFSLSNIFPGTTVDIASDADWNPAGDEGTFTVVYAFDENDQDSSDDMLTFNINLTRSYVDLAV